MRYTKMRGKERKRKEEHKNEEKREQKVQKIIPFKAKKREEREEKQDKKVQRSIPFEGKAKKEEGKEERQGKRVHSIIPFKEERNETLTTLFAERMLGSMPNDEVGVAPAAPAPPRLSAYRRADWVPFFQANIPSTLPFPGLPEKLVAISQAPRGTNSPIPFSKQIFQARRGAPFLDLFSKRTCNRPPASKLCTNSTSPPQPENPTVFSQAVVQPAARC